MKKKLLFVTWSLTLGGGEAKSVCNILNNLNLDKYEIEVFELNKGNKEVKINNNIKFLKPIVDYTNDNIRNQKIELNRYIKNPKSIKNLFNKNYDCVIACNRGTTSYISSFIPSLKKIVWIRGSIDNFNIKNNRDEFKKNIETEKNKQDEIFYKFDKIVVVSDYLFDSFNKIFPNHKNKLVKIYNSINPNEIKAKAKENINSYESKSNNLIVSVGRLREVKNHKLLIDAVKKLVDNNIDVELIIIGEGLLKDELNEYIKKNNLNDYVKLIGFYENPYPIISQAKLFCLSSISEGFNLSVSEACTLGLPFVSTDVGGTKEILDKAKCGLIADWDDNDYATKIYKLLSDENLYNLFKTNCNIASSFFSTKELGLNVEKLIDNLFKKEVDSNELS